MRSTLDRDGGCCSWIHDGLGSGQCGGCAQACGQKIMRWALLQQSQGLSYIPGLNHRRKSQNEQDDTAVDSE